MDGKRRRRKRWFTLIAVLAGCMVAAALGEGVLRWYFPAQDLYYVWPPDLNIVFRPDPAILPGVQGDARFFTNSSGVRGDEFSDDQAYRVLAIGGSTTECAYLDQAETWPALLQDRLARVLGRKVWVSNVGKSGMNTRDHVLHTKYLLPQFPRIDAVLLLVGVNDFHLATSDTTYDPQAALRPEYEEKQRRRSFARIPAQGPRYHYSRTGIWRLISVVKEVTIVRTLNLPAQTTTGEMYRTWREHRLRGRTIVDNLPDLKPALDEYRRNLDIIVGHITQKGARLILITQPTMWRPDLASSEQQLLWMGGIGQFQEGKAQGYYSVSALDRGMRQYNAVTMEVCRKHSLTCIDLSDVVTRDTSVFYDDVHFNESGALTVAKLVADTLRTSLPATVPQKPPEIGKPHVVD